MVPEILINDLVIIALLEMLLIENAEGKDEDADFDVDDKVDFDSEEVELGLEELD